MKKNLLNYWNRITLLPYVMVTIALIGPLCGFAVNKNVWLEDPYTRDSDQEIDVCLGQTRPFTATTSFLAGGTWNWVYAVLQSSDYPHSYATKTFSETGTHDVKATYTRGLDSDTSYAAIVTVIPRTIVTETEATAPSNRSRTTIGVGERVSLTLSPGPSSTVNWSIISGSGQHSSSSGNPITFSAFDRSSTPTIRAEHDGHTHDISLNVIQPSSILYENNHEYLLGACPPGSTGYGLHYWANVYYGPDTVNFYRIETFEGNAIAVKSGYFLNGNPSHTI